MYVQMVDIYILVLLVISSKQELPCLAGPCQCQPYKQRRCPDELSSKQTMLSQSTHRQSRHEVNQITNHKLSVSACLQSGLQFVTTVSKWSY